MKLELKCYDGFGYTGWNRVEARLVNGTNGGMPRGVNVSRALGDMLVATCVVKEIGLGHGLHSAGDVMYVQGGESFTFEDFAEFVSDVIGLPIVLLDAGERRLVT